MSPTKKIKGRASRGSNTKVKAVAIWHEPIDQVVTPWLLVVMVFMTAVFVVLQYISA